MTLIYRYKNTLEAENTGFKVVVDDRFPDDIEIHNIDLHDKIKETFTIPIPKGWLDKVVNFVNSNKKVLKLSTWLVNCDSTYNESFFYFETEKWNREIYCFTLGALTDYTNLKYSKDRDYLYKVFKKIQLFLLEIGVQLNINSYKIMG